MSATETTTLPDYAPLPETARGPALNEQGYTSAAWSGTSTTSPTAPTCRRS